MKKNRILSLLSAGLLLLGGACTSDVINPNGSNQDDSKVVDPSEGMYLRVAFDLPTAKSTRSFTDGPNSSNSGTEIGHDYENTVKSALIVLAKANDNSFIASALVGKENIHGVGTTGRSYQAIGKISKTSLSEYYDSEEFAEDANGNHKINVFDVFQYFFCGIVTTFDDDARTIAFGFIRADIDATRRRRNLRLARLAKAESLKSVAGQSDSEELKDAGLKSRPEASADEKPEPISRDDEERVYGLVRTWNQVMTPLGCKTIPTLTPCSHELYRPVLRALKRKPFREIFETIMHLPDVQPRPKFAEFFNSI